MTLLETLDRLDDLHTGKLLNADFDYEARVLWPFIVIEARALLQERDALKAENEEQARLLGISGSKEARLIAENEALRAKYGEKVCTDQGCPCHEE